MTDELGDGLADGEGAARTDDGPVAGLRAGLWATLADTAGAALAGWLPPRIRLSPIPSPARARTAPTTATPDRKLISSMRAFSTRLSLKAQPVPSLTTKHDTGDTGF